MNFVHDYMFMCNRCNAMPDKTPIVLLVEDNPDHALLTRRALEDVTPAVEFIHIADGDKAMTFLEDHEAAPSAPWLILLDLRLPRRSGFEVLERLKQNEFWRRVPVVIFTSSERDADVEEALRLFANSYVVKPTDFNKFQELIRAMAEYWLQWSKLPHQQKA